jgi:hypothetical protein
LLHVEGNVSLILSKNYWNNFFYIKSRATKEPSPFSWTNEEVGSTIFLFFVFLLLFAFITLKERGRKRTEASLLVRKTSHLVSSNVKFGPGYILSLHARDCQSAFTGLKFELHKSPRQKKISSLNFSGVRVRLIVRIVMFKQVIGK